MEFPESILLPRPRCALLGSDLVQTTFLVFAEFERAMTQ